jgi:Dickkopf N-terminal cysteine-rich region
MTKAFISAALLLVLSCRSSPTGTEVKTRALRPLVDEAGPGDTCATDSDCGTGYYCYTSASATDGGAAILFCVAQQGGGGPCTANDQCLSAVCCNVQPLSPVCLGPGCF